MASHAGCLLEQRSAFLGAQGERLIDHALADEEEGVVGQVGGIEEIDEVAQAHLLAIEQVLVLARAEEPPAALDESVFDRQQTIVVADDEAHVGHARGVPAGGTGEDDVLRLAGPQRAALLAERPAQRVREVALAAAVGTDDGADAGPELQPRGFGEGLEADQAELAQARLGHRADLPLSSADEPVRRTVRAAAAAAVSASRRLCPSPVPMAVPSSSTSTT